MNIIVNIGYMNVNERILKLMRYSSRKNHVDDDCSSSTSKSRSGSENLNNNITTSTTFICPPPNVITYSILHKEYFQSRIISSPSSPISKSDVISCLLTIVLSIDIETVKPDIVIYNTLINAYIESNRVDSAYIVNR